MNTQDRTDWFQNIETIVAEPLNFKAKLAIGEDAYTSLKVKNAAFQAWEVAGVATTAVVVAKSSVVASTFFAPTGFLAAIGFGTAVTPVGWVIAAGVVTGGAWVGIDAEDVPSLFVSPAAQDGFLAVEGMPFLGLPLVGDA